MVARAIDPNNFFPNLSMKVEVKGVNSMDEIPNEPIKTPISDLVNPCSSKNSGSKKMKKNSQKIKNLQLLIIKNFYLD